MERLGIYGFLFGTRGRFLASAAATIGLSSIAVGCGRDEVAYMAPAPPPPAETGRAPVTVPTEAARRPAPPAAKTVTEAPAKAAPPPAAAPPAATGDEAGIRVPARFTVTGAGLTPDSITVPAFLPVEVTLVSADGREHTLGIGTPDGGLRLRVAAGATARLDVEGLQPGEYLVSLDGAATDARLRAAP